jgi:myosin heavy subunit
MALGKRPTTRSGARNQKNFMDPVTPLRKTPQFRHNSPPATPNPPEIFHKNQKVTPKEIHKEMHTQMPQSPQIMKEQHHKILEEMQRGMQTLQISLETHITQKLKEQAEKDSQEREELKVLVQTTLNNQTRMLDHLENLQQSLSQIKEELKQLDKRTDQITQLQTTFEAAIEQQKLVQDEKYRIHPKESESQENNEHRHKPELKLRDFRSSHPMTIDLISPRADPAQWPGNDLRPPTHTHTTTAANQTWESTRVSEDRIYPYSETQNTLFRPIRKTQNTTTGEKPTASIEIHQTESCRQGYWRKILRDSRVTHPFSILYPARNVTEIVFPAQDLQNMEKYLTFYQQKFSTPTPYKRMDGKQEPLTSATILNIARRRLRMLRRETRGPTIRYLETHIYNSKELLDPSDFQTLQAEVLDTFREMNWKPTITLWNIPKPPSENNPESSTSPLVLSTSAESPAKKSDISESS